MGILDGLLGSFTPEQSQAIAASLLQRGGDPLEKWAQGLLGAQQVKTRTAAQERQQLELENLRKQMQQQQEAQQRAQQLRGLQSQYFQPGQAAIPEPAPELGGGPGQAAMPPKNDMRGYAQAALNQGLMNPMEAAQLGQKENPYAKIDPKDYTPESIQKFSVSQNTADLVPYRKPEQPHVFTVNTNGMTYTYERQPGGENKLLGKSPQWKPDTPDKPEKPPAGYRATPDGGLAFIPGGPADPKAGRATDTERTAAGYQQRMAEAEKVLGPLEASSGKPGVIENILQNKGPTGEAIANMLPSQGLPGLMVGFAGRTPERQQYRQAQEDWVRAKLRKESGAVIADSEMAREISTYFPMPGDAPEVIAQKARARQTAIQAMATGAGPAATQFSPQQQTGSVRKYDPATGTFR